MKLKLFLLPAAVLGLLAGACKPIDPVRDFAEYTDCVVYAYDSSTGTGVATDYAKITVKGDMTSGLFSLELADFKLTENGPVATATVGSMTQMLKDVTDSVNNTTQVLYTYFSKQGNASADGGFSVSDLKFGWLSSVYWAEFYANNTIRVWSLPRTVETYAGRNDVINERGDSLLEQAIHPRYDFDINTSASTVSLHGSGITLPSSKDEAATAFVFRNLNWDNIPVSFNDRGFTAYKPEIRFFSDEGEFIVSDFVCSFDANYDGERKATYTIKSVATGETLSVTTRFEYYRKGNG